MKKVSIREDLEEILCKMQDAIDECRTSPNVCLRMSDDTLKSLPIPKMDFLEKECSHDKSTGILGEWKETKIVIDDLLDFGEIVIK